MGHFLPWKKHWEILKKTGKRLAIGEMKPDCEGCQQIVDHLRGQGVAVSNMVPPHQLAEIYRSARLVIFPMDVVGGGERALLEARACGAQVEVTEDNPKLQCVPAAHSPLSTGPLPASQLRPRAPLPLAMPRRHRWWLVTRGLAKRDAGACCVRTVLARGARARTARTLTRHAHARLSIRYLRHVPIWDQDYYYSKLREGIADVFHRRGKLLASKTLDDMTVNELTERQLGIQ